MGAEVAHARVAEKNPRQHAHPRDASDLRGGAGDPGRALDREPAEAAAAVPRGREAAGAAVRHLPRAEADPVRGVDPLPAREHDEHPARARVHLAGGDAGAPRADSRGEQLGRGDQRHVALPRRQEPEQAPPADDAGKDGGRRGECGWFGVFFRRSWSLQPRRTMRCTSPTRSRAC